MATLLINGEDLVITLQPGTSRVGRNGANTICINNPSVSGNHCELLYESGILTVKDLGSTNGTFVNNNRIQESTVAPGQTLKFGSVEAFYQPGEQIALQEEPPAPPAIEQNVVPTASVISGNCLNHPSVIGKVICQKCGSTWCGTCVKSQMIGMRPLLTCPSCNGICTDLAKHLAEQTKKAATFSSLLRTAFLYPLKGNGLALILAGGLFFGVLDGAQQFLGFAGLFVGGAVLVAGVFSVGYLFAFLKSIINCSAAGQDIVPNFPEISNIGDDIVRPFFQCTVLWIACLGPATTAFAFGYDLAGISLLIGGLFVTPMAILALSMADGVSGLNPLVIIPSIFKVFGKYLVACILMATVFIAKIGGELLMQFVPIPFLPTLIASTFSLYFLTVEMRILGILYLTSQKSSPGSDNRRSADLPTLRTKPKPGIYSQPNFITVQKQPP